MKAPTKGGGYALTGYGTVTVKIGPSPDEPTVVCSLSPDKDDQFVTFHVDEFHERRIE